MGMVAQFAKSYRKKGTGSKEGNKKWSGKLNRHVHGMYSTMYMYIIIVHVHVVNEYSECTFQSYI